MASETLSEKSELLLSQDFHVKWKLTLDLPSCNLRTPAYKPLPNTDFSFLFEIIFKAIRHNSSDDKITLCIKMIKLNSSNVNESLKMRVTVSLTDSYGYDKMNKKLDIHNLRTMDDIKFPILKYVQTTRQRLLGSIDKQIFYLQCDLNILDDIKTHPMYRNELGSLMNVGRFAQEFKLVYEPSVFSDVVIRVENKTIAAHKTVLVAHSPVFMKMLTQDFVESKTNSITITDVSHEIFDCFLKYLYSAEIEDKSWPAVGEMYALAHKYDVATLKAECTYVMISLLDMDNVCEILQTAFHFDNDLLKEEAKRFAIDNIQELISREEWQQLAALQPHIGYAVSDGCLREKK